MLKKLKECSHNPDLGLLVFRLFVGLAMALAHGLAKTPPPDRMIEGLTGMGFPMPLFFAWCAALAELVGGLFIAAGLLTRLSALALGFTMAIAGFVAHANDPFQSKELAFMYLASCVLLIFTGAGKYSLDKIICRKN